MYTLMVSISTALMISIIMTLLSKLISKKTIIDREKLTPFECGFNPKTHPRTPFSVSFFLISMLFLIFDIEIALMLPMIPIMKNSELNYWLISSTLFIIILLMGLYYEWNQGVLNWTT